MPTVQAKKINGLATENKDEDLFPLKKLVYFRRFICSAYGCVLKHVYSCKRLF